MKPQYSIVLILMLISCNHEQEKIKIDTTTHVKEIDRERSWSIKELDKTQNDTTVKIRGYYSGDILGKLVVITTTKQTMRDDYFYFRHMKPLFTGHMNVDLIEHTADEYKYYFDEKGKISMALQFSDHFRPGKPFPEELFQPFTTNYDSILIAENVRIQKYLHLLEEGHILKDGKITN